jgi:methylenetetrahydrofolate dehydrogenase (NADP+)/methenyltetrahydrofolate cyclohydrolase
MIKQGAIIVDVGINKIDGTLYGDVDYENVKEKTSYITPVPGGIGPMTICCLMENIYEAYLLQNNN